MYVYLCMYVTNMCACVIQCTWSFWWEDT